MHELFLAAGKASQIPGGDIHVSGVAWGLFIALIAALILADLFVFHRESHEVTPLEAAISSAIWIAIGLSFSIVLWVWLGGSAAGQYLTGYVIEKSLSVDNVFVWAVIFTYFSVPKQFQHTVLFWGIFGALVLRLLFILTGVALIETFDWIMYVFGAFLIITAIRVFSHSSDDIHPEKNPVLKLMRRFVPVSSEYDGANFTVRRDGRRLATPLLVVLVLVEATDVVFAVDSIPAILAVSQSPFIVFSSNAFAILGLRALYFLLAGASDKLVHLNKGLGIILAFVGIKMLIAEWIHIETIWSLTFIAVVLTVTVVASLRSDAANQETTTEEATK